jgi:hypothetical protein
MFLFYNEKKGKKCTFWLRANDEGRLPFHSVAAQVHKGKQCFVGFTKCVYVFELSRILGVNFDLKVKPHTRSVALPSLT